MSPRQQELPRNIPGIAGFHVFHHKAANFRPFTSPSPASQLSLPKAEMVVQIPAQTQNQLELVTGQHKRPLSRHSPDLNENHKEEVEAAEEEEHYTASGVHGGRKKLCSRGHWRPAEDSQLIELVSQYGPQNWNLMAEHLHGRSGKSCRLRWFNQLDPRINRRVFSEEEEDRLLAAHGMYGNKWAMIARLFPGRTDNAIKNHWHVIVARQQREQSNVYRRRKHLPSSPVSQSQQLLIPNKRFAAVHQRSSESAATTSTNIGDDLSTFTTDLSLTPSSNNRETTVQLTFIRFSQPGKLLTEKEEVTIMKRSGNSCSSYSNGSNDHNNGSSSGGSDYGESCESVAAVGGKSFSLEKISRSDDDNEKGKIMTVHFIDFLGVGAT